MNLDERWRISNTITPPDNISRAKPSTMAIMIPGNVSMKTAAMQTITISTPNAPTNPLYKVVTDAVPVHCHLDTVMENTTAITLKAI